MRRWVALGGMLAGASGVLALLAFGCNLVGSGTAVGDAMVPPTDSPGRPDGDLCPGTTVLCGTQCVDTQTDPQNCGACGNGCGDAGPRAGCVMGACVKCAPTVDFMTDAENCGACGRSCEGSTCTAGRCDPVRVAAVDNPYAMGSGPGCVYYSTATQVFCLPPVDGGVPSVVFTPNAITMDMAPSSGGVFLAHTNGVTFVAGDAAVTLDGYKAQYGIVSDGVGTAWWTAQMTPELQTATLDAGSPTNLYTGAPGASGIARGQGALFWVNGTAGVVRTVPLDGGTPQIVASLTVTRPFSASYRAIVVGTHLVWSEPSSADAQSDGRLARLSLSGDGGAAVALATGLANPQMLATDGTYVYFTNAGTAPGFLNGSVQRIKADGSEAQPTTLWQGPLPYGIAVVGTHVYFARCAPASAMGGIYRIPVAGL